MSASDGQLLLDAAGRICMRVDHRASLSDGAGDGCVCVTGSMFHQPWCIGAGCDQDLYVYGPEDGLVRIHGCKRTGTCPTWQIFIVRTSGSFELVMRNAGRCTTGGGWCSMGVRVNGSIVGHVTFAFGVASVRRIYVTLTAGDIVEVSESCASGADLGGDILSDSDAISLWNSRFFGGWSEAPFITDFLHELYGASMVIAPALPVLTSCPAEDADAGLPVHDGQVNLSDHGAGFAEWSRTGVRHSTGDWKLKDTFRLEVDTSTNPNVCTAYLTRWYYRGSDIPAWFGQQSFFLNQSPIVIPRLYGCDATASYSVS